MEHGNFKLSRLLWLVLCCTVVTFRIHGMLSVLCAHSFEATARSKHTLDVYERSFDGAPVKSHFIFAVIALSIFDRDISTVLTKESNKF